MKAVETGLVVRFDFSIIRISGQRFVECSLVFCEGQFGDDKLVLAGLLSGLSFSSIFASLAFGYKMIPDCSFFMRKEKK